MRMTGVTARGVIMPVFKEGDPLAEMICQNILKASTAENFPIEDGDIVGVTEAVVARTQGNYATTEQIAADVRAKLGEDTIGLVFPIMSRNRFAVLLSAFASSCKRLVVQLSYPADEVGNLLIDPDLLDEKGVDPYRDSFTEAEFRATFGSTVHRFTGVDYIEYYKSLGDNVEIILSNDPAYILNYTKNVIACDIHTRQRTKRRLAAAGAERLFTLDEILNAPVNGSGCNEQYGLLGSNKATETRVKLFPRDTESFVAELHRRLAEATGKNVEVMIYGDGGFKDPVGGIWEFADPVVSPAHTPRLSGTPNEIKMKYFADNEFSHLSGAELEHAMKEKILAKDANLVGRMSSEGTTPRRISDLVGSLCDLVSGSGDRGTPVVYIKGYFTNFATE
ncbi:MAG: coenzyme F420-0:L-glutamate ligase [Clostridiales bacterium]|nr:coenzyme F420-0:L-glutamate ligase [Clostridiales bacterium]MDD7310469.1 coenzyme F420-0:L-glutamate ligase [Eubacteriales bacterium]MDY5347801.1 coenzyme F420-0:L-glutamate ligase [Eubacteriales bacterium]